MARLLWLVFTFCGAQMAFGSSQANNKCFSRTTTAPFANTAVVTDPGALLRVIQDMLPYFKHNYAVVESSLLAHHGISRDAAYKTLMFIEQVIEQDRGKAHQRITDSRFLSHHFNFLKWHGDKGGYEKAGARVSWKGDGLDGNNIRLTSYAVFMSDGGDCKSDKYPVALYGLVEETPALKKFMKTQSRDDLFGDGFNTQEIAPCVRPLVWVNSKAASDALMEGTIIIKMPDGNLRYFNVHKPYTIASNDPNPVRDIRYWFFKEVNDINGNDGGPHLKKLNHSKVLFAGDTKQLGLGKIIALDYTNPRTQKKEVRLGVLGDTGDAFRNNLYQLDIFAGIYENRKDFWNDLRSQPSAAQAYFLVKKNH